MNILVTGGSSGLGAEIVKLLSQNNSNTVYFTFSKLMDKAKFLSSVDSNVKAYHCDFTDEVSVDVFLEEMKYFNLDILINSAIVGYEKQHFHKINSNYFLKSFQQNILPTIRITQAFIIKARKNKFGKIINIISSYNINKPPIGLSEYVANKAYLLSLSKSWATENIQFNITSNSISPSFMLTRLTADTDERIVEQMTESHPLKKLLTTKEVAEAVVFYTTCSPQINGTNLVINAGNDLQ